MSSKIYYLVLGGGGGGFLKVGKLLPYAASVFLGL